MLAKNPVQLLQKALRGGYAIGAFNVNNLELLQGIIRGAVAQRAPVILQTSEGAIAYAGMEELLAMMRVAAARVRVPVVLHLDHGKDIDIIRAAIKAGYTSVMYDGSSLPYDENVRNTMRVVRWAHDAGVVVEAELGAIAGTEDAVSVADREATYTIPEQALDFVERTGCDSLAVAIGTAHGVRKSPTVNQQSAIVLDIARLKRIHALLPKVPLVLHGASSVPESLVGETEMYCALLGDCQRLEGAQGIPDEQVRQAIGNGVCKINTDTDLRIAFTSAVRETLIEHKQLYDPRELLGPARDSVQRIVEQRIVMFGSAGRA
ncbi:MAG: class II fructose-bisphosphate aldolase [bacterium]|nr:class II fructose-bisphosphate aldolase [bacterium]